MFGTALLAGVFGVCFGEITILPAVSWVFKHFFLMCFLNNFPNIWGKAIVIFFNSTFNDPVIYHGTFVHRLSNICLFPFSICFITAATNENLYIGNLSSAARLLIVIALYDFAF